VARIVISRTVARAAWPFLVTHLCGICTSWRRLESKSGANIAYARNLARARFAAQYAHPALQKISPRDGARGIRRTCTRAAPAASAAHQQNETEKSMAKW